MYRLHHICRSAFKNIVFQDRDTEQENVSHTADITDDCSQLLSNSLATRTIMVSAIFTL